jgi:hypothetical protein
LAASVANVTLKSSVSGALVRVDGAAAGTTPLAAPLLLNPGKHRIEISREGYATFTRELDIGGGASAQIDAPLLRLEVTTLPGARTPVYKKWWLWTAIGAVVAAGAVTGGVLGARAGSPTNELTSMLPVVR